MLNLREDIVLVEELSERILANNAQIRDLLLENEQMIKLAKDPHNLLTREEVAKKLRCDENKIPRSIPRIRISKNWCFEQGDVESFVEKHKKITK